jgi:hypothetical protein
VGALKATQRISILDVVRILDAILNTHAQRNRMEERRE